MSQRMVMIMSTSSMYVYKHQNALLVPTKTNMKHQKEPKEANYTYTTQKEP
jgi:hypothetical protein